MSAPASSSPAVRLLYFSWVRERIGKAEEMRAPPAELVTVGDLMGWLAGQGEGYARAFEPGGRVRAAVDRRRVGAEAPFAGAREIAFFPPMTGG